MKQWFFVVLLYVFTSGCISSQIIPKGNVLSPIRTISIVPIECPPLILYPVTPDDRAAVDAMMRVATPPTSASPPSSTVLSASPSIPSASFVNAPSANIRTGASVLTIIGGIAILVEAASAGKEVPGETAVIEMDQPTATWMASVEYAKTAVVALQQAGPRDLRVIDGYVRLPITDRSMTWHMENWNGPINRWYNSDVSTVDYAAIGSNYADAILEVGVFSYQYYREALILHVFVKLIDPRTKQVLGRARSISFPSQKAGPLAPLLQNDAEGMKCLILETGNRLVAKCLTKLGLISE